LTKYQSDSRCRFASTGTWWGALLAKAYFWPKPSILSEAENQPHEQADEQNGDRTEQHSSGIATELVIKEKN
jgi:hypothetical protein